MGVINFLNKYLDISNKTTTRTTTEDNTNNNNNEQQQQLQQQTNNTTECLFNRVITCWNLFHLIILYFGIVFLFDRNLRIPSLISLIIFHIFIFAIKKLLCTYLVRYLFFYMSLFYYLYNIIILVNLHNTVIMLRISPLSYHLIYLLTEGRRYCFSSSLYSLSLTIISSI